jgi:nucleotide-binding universal stress UspA family protein
MPDAIDGSAGPIVVGADGSKSSTDALGWAIRQAKFTGSALRVVLTWVWPSAAGTAGVVPSDFDPGADAQHELDLVVSQIRDAHPDLTVEWVLVEGPAGPALVDSARGASLLVVGSRGHGQLAGILLGSVSEYCVAHAECPVLVLREPAAG